MVSADPPANESFQWHAHVLGMRMGGWRKKARVRVERVCDKSEILQL